MNDDDVRWIDRLVCAKTKARAVLYERIVELAPQCPDLGAVASAIKLLEEVELATVALDRSPS